jgi:hypothetical protein
MPHQSREEGAAHRRRAREHRLWSQFKLPLTAAHICEPSQRSQSGRDICRPASGECRPDRPQDRVAKYGHKIKMVSPLGGRRADCRARDGRQSIRADSVDMRLQAKPLGGVRAKKDSCLVTKRGSRHT